MSDEKKDWLVAILCMIGLTLYMGVAMYCMKNKKASSRSFEKRPSSSEVTWWKKDPKSSGQTD